MQEDVEQRIRQMRQIGTTRYGCILEVCAHILCGQDGVAGGFRAGIPFVGKLLGRLDDQIDHQVTRDSFQTLPEGVEVYRLGGGQQRLRQFGRRRGLA